MPSSFTDRVAFSLLKREQQDRLRSLPSKTFSIDFSSNDYLGLSRSAWIHSRVESALMLQNDKRSGATGSRLLSGNLPAAEILEQHLAVFHHAETALLFNSGFDANSGLIATIVQAEDIVFADEAVHASIHWGLKFSGAKVLFFKHNDVVHLEELLSLNQEFQVKWIITESYFSMDGDIAPLKELVLLCKKFNAEFIVDEAHAVGVFGKNGRGLCERAGVENECTARVITFGKAIGAHGAAVLCSSQVKKYLINFCKPFIYSTAISNHSIYSVLKAYEFLEKFDHPQHQLERNIKFFKENSRGLNVAGDGPVFAVIIPDEKEVRAAAVFLQQHGLDIRPIVFPTVSVGTERLRINLHSFNTQKEINLLIELLHQL